MTTDAAQLERLRELARGLGREVDAAGPAGVAHVVERYRGLESTGEARDIALAAVRANVVAFAEAVEHDMPADRWEAPLMALGHERRLARAGIGLDDILRLYRFGQEWLFERVSQLAREETDDPACAAALIEQAGLLLFRYIDAVCVRVAAEYEAEREAMVRGALARREGVVRALLAGEPVDIAAAEATLGYRLSGRHVAVLCWTQRRRDGVAAETGAEDAAGALAGALGAGRPLIVSEHAGCVGAWIAVAEATRVDRVALEDALREATPGARAAIGTARTGIDGFRRSRREAEHARAVALASAREPLCVAYGDVALVGLLAADVESARRFVADQLGDLARDDSAHDTLRRTVFEVFRAGGSHKVAAHVLHVHRNTIAHRLARAEEILARPLDRERQELEAALLLAHWLGSRVLSTPPDD